MTRWLLGGLGGLAVVVAVMLVWGWLLPVSHVASRSAVIALSPAAAYARVADVPAYPRWWSEMSAVDILPAVAGRPRYREHMRSGPVIFETVAAAPPTRFVSRIADPDQPFGGTWTFEIAPDADGARVTITEQGEVYNPMFRFLSRYVFSQTANIESCLAALAMSARP